MEGLDAVGRRCLGGHDHVQLKGTHRSATIGRWVNRTAKAAECSPAFCRFLCRLVEDAAAGTRRNTGLSEGGRPPEGAIDERPASPGASPEERRLRPLRRADFRRTAAERSAARYGLRGRRIG